MSVMTQEVGYMSFENAGNASGKQVTVRFRCGHSEVHTFSLTANGMQAERRFMAASISQLCRQCYNTAGHAVSIPSTNGQHPSITRALHLLNVSYSTPACVNRDQSRWAYDVQWRTMPIVDLIRKRLLAMYAADQAVCIDALAVMMPTLSQLSGVYGLSYKTIINSRGSNWLGLIVASLRDAGLDSAVLYMSGANDVNK
jgi:hypothetical protein